MYLSPVRSRSSPSRSRPSASSAAPSSKSTSPSARRATRPALKLWRKDLIVVSSSSLRGQRERRARRVLVETGRNHRERGHGGRRTGGASARAGDEGRGRGEESRVDFYEAPFSRDGMAVLLTEQDVVHGFHERMWPHARSTGR